MENGGDVIITKSLEFKISNSSQKLIRPSNLEKMKIFSISREKTDVMWNIITQEAIFHVTSYTSSVSVSITPENLIVVNSNLEFQ